MMDYSATIPQATTKEAANEREYTRILMIGLIGLLRPFAFICGSFFSRVCLRPTARG